MRILTREPDPKKIVRDGYDRISYRCRDDLGNGPTTDPLGQSAVRPDYEAWLDKLIPELNDGDAVLDLGCGCGVPATALLAERYAVTGVDLSPVQIERARRLVPAAQLFCADMSMIDFPAASFDAVVSFFAIVHVPVAEQRAIFTKIHRWLKPRGYLLITVGSRRWTGIEADWLGAPMYWSQTNRRTYGVWLGTEGFVVLRSWFIPEGSGGHVLILAKTITLPLLGRVSG